MIDRRVTLAIARRELLASFGQPPAYVFLGGFLAIAAVLGLNEDFFSRNVADLRDYFAGLDLAFTFLAPAVAMRLWAEERRLGTFELLFTLPVRPAEAVLGKFLAGSVLLATALLLGTLLPLSLFPFGPFDYGQVFSGYLGAFLLGTSYLALGLVASAVSTSQVVAFVLGALGCVGLRALGEPLLLAQLQRVVAPELVATLAELGTQRHYRAVCRGIVDLRDLAFFVALTASLLSWNTLLIERRQRSRLEPWTAAALVLAALVLFTVLLAGSGSWSRFDVTLQGRNSLTGETKAVLAKVEQPLTIRAYFSESLPESRRPQVRRLRDLLTEIELELGSLATLEWIDPNSPLLSPGDRHRRLQQASEDGIEEQVVVSAGDRQVEQAVIYAGIAFHYGGRRPATIPFALDLENPERDLAVAIQRVVLERLTVGLAASPTDFLLKEAPQLQKLLEQAFAVEEVDLDASPQVREAVDVLVYAAPAGNVPARHLYLIDQYLVRGGTVVFLAESHNCWPGSIGIGDQWAARAYPRGYGTYQVLEAWGLSLGPSLVLTPATARQWEVRQAGRARHYRGPYPWYVEAGRDANADSPVARDLHPLTLFYAAEVSSRASRRPPGVTAKTLLRSDPGYTLKDLGELERGFANVDPERRELLTQLPQQLTASSRKLAVALRGPLPSVFAANAQNPAWAVPAWPRGRGRPDPLATPQALPSGKGCLIVVGDTNFVLDSYQGVSKGVPLLVNMIEWSLDRSLSEIQSGQAVFALNSEPARLLGLPRQTALAALHALALPILIPLLGLVGIAVWRRRRARQAALARDARAARVAQAAAAADPQSGPEPEEPPAP